MNLKQIAVAGLACCAFAVSCKGNDTKISYEDAEKYVKEHCTLTEAPKPKSGKIEWNFNDMTKEDGTMVFSSILPLFKDTTKTYTVSGSADLNIDTTYSTVGSSIFVVLNENTLKNKYKDYNLYQNGSGIKITKETSKDDQKSVEEYQFDDKGRILTNYMYQKGEMSSIKLNASEKFIFAY